MELYTSISCSFTTSSPQWVDKEPPARASFTCLLFLGVCAGKKIPREAGGENVPAVSPILRELHALGFAVILPAELRACMGHQASVPRK